MINRPTIEERQKDWEDFVADEAKLLLNKGADYTAGKKDADAYANFRIIADILKGAPVTPYTVAMIYGLKHVLSLITFAITGKQESGEGLRGRHMDARNYFFIMNELVPDHVNHFAEEEAARPKLNEPFTEQDRININKLFDEAVEKNRASTFGPAIVVDPLMGTTEYFNENDGQWHPIAELDSIEVSDTKKGKEVDNTTENARLGTWCCLGTPLTV